MDWIPIAERLPACRTVVLARVVNSAVQTTTGAVTPFTVREVVFSPLLSAWIEFTTSDVAEDPLQVTHWRELHSSDAAGRSEVAPAAAESMATAP